MYAKELLRSALGIALIAQPLSALAITFTPGDIYTSNYSSSAIIHQNSAGVYVDSMTLSPAYGSEVRGLAFGPQGWLYAVTQQNLGFGVVAIDSTGTVRESYTGSTYVGGNLSYGKIAFSSNGQFFVTGQNSLIAFTPGIATGTTVYSNNQVFDVDALPSGNLLVLSAYQLKEITPTGSVVRTITPNISLGDARGVEYNPATNDIYISMLGYSGQSFRLMRLDGTSGTVEKNESFWYGDDMFLTSDNKLIVGSRTQAPGIFDLDLNRTGTLTAGQQMFVTQMPVPEPNNGYLMAAGLSILLLRSRHKLSFSSLLSSARRRPWA
jgi:WD40 repeat protein